MAERDAGRGLSRFFPDMAAPDIYGIDLAGLRALGIDGLIFDIDNTLVKPGDDAPDARAAEWFKSLSQYGFRVCLLSNSGRRRVARFESAFGAPAVSGAMKPVGAGFRKALNILGLGAHQACMIGDQIFTDVVGAKRLGIYAVLTSPITRDEGVNVRLKRPPERFILKAFEKRENKRK